MKAQGMMKADACRRTLKMSASGVSIWASTLFGHSTFVL
jgi:hypothetical protein